MHDSDPIVIVSAKRTPIGNFDGYFKNTSATELGSYSIKANLAETKLDPKHVGEVIMGCVLPAGLGQAPARQAALSAGLGTHSVCSTLNKVCGSGMKAVMLAHDAVKLGTTNIVIAGGMENMTCAPYLLPNARFGYRLGHGKMLDHMLYDGLEDAYEKGTSMGVFAERCAEKYNFSREQQDAFAKHSLECAKMATDKGAFAAEITPVTIHDKKTSHNILHDQGPETVTAEKIAKLKPAFKKDGTITAANASSISDGAATLMVTRASIAKTLNLKPLAIIHGHYTHAQAPEWFSTAPTPAIKALLHNIDWTLEDVDLFEINEAFAVVTMACIKDLSLDPAKVNVNGGACVLGHPIGASGARILVTLLHALKQRGLTKGIAALCIGGGEATAIAISIVEN